MKQIEAKDKTRDIRFTIRFTQSELDTLKDLMADSWPHVSSVSEIIRICLFKRTDFKHVTVFTNPSEISAAINKFGRNLDAYLKLARTLGIEKDDLAELEKLSHDVTEFMQNVWDDYKQKVGVQYGRA